MAPACANPVIDAQIEALGGEQANVEEGPFHRPGQPCLLCHGPYFGAPEFSVAGTIFADQKGAYFKTVEDVEVVLTDAIGESRTKVTNCIGNFYFFKDEWDPQFPLAAEIRYPVYDPNTGEKMMETVTGSDGLPTERTVRKVKAMGSWISRDGSCASCHSLYGHGPTVDPAGAPLYYDSAGWIYCNGAGDGVSAADTNFFPDIGPDNCAGVPPNSGGTSTSTSTGATP